MDYEKMYNELKKFVDEKRTQALKLCGLRDGYSDDDYYDFYVDAQECGNAGDTWGCGVQAGDLSAYEEMASKISSLELTEEDPFGIAGEK